MTAITLQEIQKRQSELADLIDKFSAETVETRTIIMPDDTVVELHAGEHYAGAVLDENGQHKHHLVLMAAVPEGKMSWNDAMKWADRVCGVLPTRQEQALLYANCKPHLAPEWHWSSEQYKDDASYAWLCYFFNGYQDYDDKSFQGCARAVRRF